MSTALFLAAFFLLWLAVLTFHWQGRFRHMLMWLPVLAAPVIILLGLASLAIEALAPIYLALLAIAILGGLLGLTAHIKGALGVQGPPGLTLPKITRIPIFLPLVWTALALIGFFAAYKL